MMITQKSIVDPKLNVDPKSIATQKSKLKKTTIAFGLLSLLILDLTVLMGSRFWFGYLIFVEVMMTAALVSTVKQTRKKATLHEFRDETFLFPLEMDFSHMVYLWILPYMLLFDFIGYESLSNMGLRWGFVLYFILILLICLGGYLLFKRWTVCYNFAYEEGLRFFSKDILFKDVKRYQFIKIRLGGYFFEINDGKSYFRFKITETHKEALEQVILPQLKNL